MTLKYCMRKNSKNHNPIRREIARDMRREMGASERVFWELVRKERLGFAFRRQVPVGSYILDFYCAKAALCVEIDGEFHEVRKDRDKIRDQTLANLGIETFRIPSLALFDQTSARFHPKMEALIALLEERSGRLATEIPRMDAIKRLRRYKL